MSLSKTLTVEHREDEPSHSDNMTSISHSLENAEPVQTNAQILLTQDGIVWAPGKVCSMIFFSKAFAVEARNQFFTTTVLFAEISPRIRYPGIRKCY